MLCGAELVVVGVSWVVGEGSEPALARAVGRPVLTAAAGAWVVDVDFGGRLLHRLLSDPFETGARASGDGRVTLRGTSA